MRKLTIEEMKVLARNRGGYCLSTEYINSQTKLSWECQKGHRWHAKPNDIQQGHWCAECSGKKRKTIEEMQEIAIARGGYCLSTEYIDARTKLSWQCQKGHRWHAKPNSIQQGRWCARCSGKKRKTIEEMQEIAIARGGYCLSTEYINARTKLSWQCNEGHTWMASAGAVIYSGTWCAKCSGNKRKTIEEMQEIAIARGGYCLSTEYINSQTKLSWECNEGHTWMASANDVINKGTWCAVCARRNIHKRYSISLITTN